MIKVAIFGASGYGGIELARMVQAHPDFELTFLGGHSTAGKKVGDIYTHLPELSEMTMAEQSYEAAAAVAEVMVFALHPGDGTTMVAEAVRDGRPTFDFSADFRLANQADYEQYYGPHPLPELLGQAVYGLPELHREAIRATNFVAVPGCYPTAGTLALAPALAHGLIEPASLIVDSMSGVSGAGRALKLGSHFSEVNESATAYGIARHRHTPEMVQELTCAAMAGPAAAQTGGTAKAVKAGTAGDIKVTFSPHLIPISRGILSTCYGNLTRELTAAEALELYADYYADSPCVRVLTDGSLPTTKAVSGTNRCDLGLTADPVGGRLIAVTAIDNLIKGLSGAALQCMNLVCGLPETRGLPMTAVWP